MTSLFPVWKENRVCSDDEDRDGGSSIRTVKSKILILIPNFDICFCIISTKETHKKLS